MQVMIKNQDKSNGKLHDTRKKTEQESIINETKLSKVKSDALLTNSI